MAAYNAVTVAGNDASVRQFLSNKIIADSKLLNYAVAVVMVCNATCMEYDPQKKLPKVGVRYNRRSKGKCVLRFKFNDEVDSVPLNIVANVNDLEAVTHTVLDVEKSGRLIVSLSLKEKKQKDSLVDSNIIVRQCPQMDSWAQDEDRASVMSILQETYNIEDIMPVLKAHVTPPADSESTFTLVISNIPNITPAYVHAVIDKHRAIIEKCIVQVYARKLKFKLRRSGQPVKVMYMTTTVSDRYSRKRKQANTLNLPPPKRSQI